MTAKQLQLLRWIVGFQEAHGGVSPSYAEMRDAMGFASKSNVGRCLRSLAERGQLRFLPNRARAIEVLRPVPVPHAPDGAALFQVCIRGLTNG